ncbi:MAG: polysaccharide deacetylase family protein [Planctomycetes bacterium]|nr:polysaccharide deacetylase family protein [Planctomycetota bacterium]
MRGIILVCYDVETASVSTDGFLAGARRMHRDLGVPATIFFTGKTIEARTAACVEAAGETLFTFGQHTYNHVLFKSVYMQPADGKPCHGKLNFLREGGTFEQLQEEVNRTQELYLKTFGRPCRGLTTPWGYYRGLADRPDLLRVLHHAGIRWVRSYARDHRDCQPTPYEVQPFFYADHGLPDLLEIPVQGYQDDFYWERFDDRQHGGSYNEYLLWALGYVAERGLVFCLNSHDHGTSTAGEFDRTKGAWLRPTLEHGLKLGLRFMGCEDFYHEREAMGKEAERSGVA